MKNSTDLALAKSLVPDRPGNSHKGTFGYLLAIAGSTGLTGAACLTCEAALRTGVGMVTLGVPRSLNNAMEARLTETMTRPLPETDSKGLSLAAFDDIERMSKRMTAIAVGPGLSINPETQRLIRKIVGKIGLPMVVDADGLSAVAGRLEVFGLREKPTIISPHLGEMSRLTDISIRDIERNREKVALDFAKKWKITVILKGAPSLVAASYGELYENTTGNSGMSTAGSGDVLTGILAALLCQGLAADDAAIFGTYLHGLAGDIAAERYTQRGMIASDMIQSLPDAWRIIEPSES